MIDERLGERSKKDLHWSEFHYLNAKISLTNGEYEE